MKSTISYQRYTELVKNVGGLPNGRRLRTVLRIRSIMYRTMSQRAKPYGEERKRLRQLADDYRAAANYAKRLHKSVLAHQRSALTRHLNRVAKNRALKKIA